MADFVFGSVAALAALLAAVVVVLCIAAMLHWGHDREQGLIPYIFYPAIAVAIFGILLSGRDLSLPIQFAIEKHALVTWATRLTSLYVLLAASERIARRILHHGRKPDAPTLLIIAFCFYFLTNVVTSALFGTHPWFSHDHLYAFFVGYAALLAAQVEGDLAVRSARNALFAFLILSALFIAWRPEMVLSRNYYQGLIPGFSVRYAGLADSANTLGPVVVVFLLCLWSRPYSARWVNLLGWAIGCASLVLAQSKTNWIAFVFCAVCLAYFRSGDFGRQRWSDFRRPLLPTAFVSLAIVMTFALGVALMFFDTGERMTAFLETPEGTQLLTLSGRERIWEVAVEEWHNNPLFGYGLTIWNPAYRAEVGLHAAFNAHNQFYQSLASA